MSLERLKKEKTKAKAAFTKTRNRLLMTLEGGLSSRQHVREQLDALSEAMENVIGSMENLEEFYESTGSEEKRRILSTELEAIAVEFDEAEEIVNVCLNKSRADSADLYGCRTPLPDKESQQSTSKRQLDLLQEEISKREEEVANILKEIGSSFRRQQGIQQGITVPDMTARQRDNAAPSAQSEEILLRTEGKDKQKVSRTPEQGETKDKQEVSRTPEQGETKDKQEVSRTPEQGETKDKQELLMAPEQGKEKDSGQNKLTTSKPESNKEEQRQQQPQFGLPVQQLKGSSQKDHLSYLHASSRNTPASETSIASTVPVWSLPRVTSTPIRPPEAVPETSKYPMQYQYMPNAYQVPTLAYSNGYSTMQLGAEASTLLTRVSIPKFSGNTKNYESWKAVFYACVDQAKASPEYKLLRLKECLQGDALKVVENLGHSPAAYEAAKSRLERKYGGVRRALALRLEELNTFKPIREGNEKDLQSLAELLEMIVVTLKDAGQEAELRSGSLYITLLKKLNKNLLAKYKQWINDKQEAETVEQLREFIDRESDFLTIASETITGVAKETARKERSSQGRTLVTQHVISANETKGQCKVCTKLHGLWACDDFKKMSAVRRWEVAKEHKVCFRCLGTNHFAESCTRSRVCGLNGCKSFHHRLLHDKSKEQRKTTSPSMEGESKEKTKSTTSVTEHAAVTNPSTKEKPEERTQMSTLVTESLPPTEYIALRTVPVYLTSGTKRVKVNALLDDASSKTYLNADVAAELGLEGTSQELTVNVLNGNQEKLHTSLVQFRVSSLDGKTSNMVSAYTTERVTGNMQVMDWNQYKHKWDHLKSIQFPSVGPRPIVDLLIGVDYAELLYSIKEVRGQKGEPMARLTPLGWTCIGRPTTQMRSDSEHTNYSFFTRTNELNQLIRRYWDIEEPKVSELVKPEERVAKKMAEESITYADGHYCVGMPWKGDKSCLTDNYSMALRRLENTEKRLLSSNQVGKDYNDVIHNYVERGYIRKVPPEDKETDRVWYLPHFPILRPDKATTKTRIVFDASAKYKNVSLNDLVHPGPKLQNDLFTVLLRFRRNTVALMCDIKEMYLQIKLKQEDRPYHRFLWRELETEREPDVYEFQRVVFGVASSPFLAQFVAQHHAQQHQQKYPLAAETILQSTYMDDSMDSAPNIETAVDLYKQLSQLWASAGMHARKWLSNSEEVLRAIPSADCVTEVDLDKGELPVTKTLGVAWSPKEDEFKFQVNKPREESTETKRGFLKGTATLFDPLGFLTPYVIRARILLQHMWASGVDWDEPLDSELAAKAQEWFDELPKLAELRIPRCLKMRAEVKEVTIHTFADASEEAYGAVVYARHEYEDGTVSCNLVAAKARVAPLQAVSIPRLELMAAIVGLRLAEKVGPALRIDKQSWKFWSDSMDTLYWIRGQSRQFKPFVANRVGEIQKATDPAQWKYVPTKQNPADLLTRGQSVCQLKDKSCWWEGPAFLKLDESEWPTSKIDQNDGQKSEVRKRFLVKQDEAGTFVSTTGEDRLEPTRHSSWRRLTRVLATVLRFLNNCRAPPGKRELGPLQREELIMSEQLLIKKAQEQAFKEEIKALKAGKSLSGSSKLLPLNPFLDPDGILRCNGRLCYAECLPWESRFPVILPKGNHITKLIIKENHELVKHGGTNLVLAELSTKYWILSAREAIKEWEKECMECRRRKVMPHRPLMAPLPTIRTRMSMRAFSQSSVDYAGPFITKQGRGKVRQKRYLCLFTCLSTRAVHLEVAYSLDTDSFLNAFFRMASRRGMPEEVLSDNGTNFVGAHNELEALKALDNNKIQDTTSIYGVKWHFNPPLAPHFSGVHEIMVKAAKKAILAILGSADITDEELVSAVVGAEALINSRPLTYQSAHPGDTVPLTPNHFLHGQLGGKFAPETVDTTSFNPRKRWRRVQELVRHFWHRWLREWLPSLNSRKKWFHSKENLEEGDVVILMSPDTPRGKWPLGRIVKTHPGPDGQVRVADVQVGKATLRRPAVKLCPLEP